ncbi:DUF3048 domain-containing protein [Candidatus Shapirobacteria bacterium]|nr:DUF3048 domain-containing protein [Candidatus Shapirobacteria bacterium]
MNKNLKKISLIIGGIGLYLISTGISYAFFSREGETQAEIVSPVVSTPTGGGSKINLNLPKTEICPLNGAKLTVPERQIWEKRRPLTVMIENHADARPQSGVSRADVVYEAVAEGGVTRFLAVFYCAAAAEEVQVGPVRSARTYFLDFASEYGDFPLYAHVGGANTPGPANALGQIGDYGWLRKGNDLNQFAIGFPTFWRDYERLGREVATEHTMYSTTEKLWAVAEKRNLTSEDAEGNLWDKNFVPWQFKDDATSLGDKSPAFSFWSAYTEYAVKWEFDPSGNIYQRINAGVGAKDRNDEQTVSAKNVVLLFAAESRANDGYESNLHLLYKLKGSGRALVFQDGKVIEGTWNKKDRKSRTIFRDGTNKEVKFNRGPIWVEVLPVGAEVSF